MRNRVCFILDWYPTPDNSGCIFAKNLIYAMADRGVECTVIAPRMVHPNVLRQKVAYHRVEETDTGAQINIYMPWYVHCSSKENLMSLSMDNHYRAVLKTIRRHHLTFDVIYGHFIYQCGLTAARIGNRLKIPAYCACGESSGRLKERSLPYSIGFASAGWKAILDKLTGMICVSTYNKELLLQNGFINSDKKIAVFPNGVDERRFHKMDQKALRKQLGFPEDAFIVAFTGTFSERKGFFRLCDALKKCENVYSIFLGKGDHTPDCDNVLYCGSVPNQEVSRYLNAADVFVLPTNGEGCCNAIVEALACGLPVISSNQSFNDDILNDSNAIRIDVENVNEIRDAINLLKNDCGRRSEMARAAEHDGRELKLANRAEKIMQFMEIDYAL